jgi:hypothetical protein
MIYLLIKFHVLSGSSIISDKTRANENSRTAAMLFDILKKILLQMKLYIFSLFIIVGP